MIPWETPLARAPRLAALAIATLILFSVPAQAGKTCGAFTVVLDTGAVFRGQQDLVIPAARLEERIPAAPEKIDNPSDTFY